VKIADINIGERVRKEPGDIERLAKSMKSLGLLHPIVVDKKNNLVAGFRRLEAAKTLGWTEVNVTVIPADPREAELEENTIRKDFTASEIHEWYEHGLKDVPKSQMKPAEYNKRVRELKEAVAEACNISLSSIQKIENIAKKAPDKLKDIVIGSKLNAPSLDRVHKRVTKRVEKIDPLHQAKNILATVSRLKQVASKAKKDKNWQQVKTLLYKAQSQINSIL